MRIVDVIGDRYLSNMTNRNFLKKVKMVETYLGVTFTEDNLSRHYRDIMNTPNCHIKFFRALRDYLYEEARYEESV